MGNNVYDLVKEERKKRNLPNIYWSREMARLAQSQANYCAKVGHMVHSSRYAFQGGELLCGSSGRVSPRQVVDGWLRSKAGHREFMLSPRIRKAGVGTARRNGKSFVAFAFSDRAPTYPDCPYYNPKPAVHKANHVPKIPTIRMGRVHLDGIINAVSIIAIILGAFLLLARLDSTIAYRIVEFVYRIIPIDEIIVGGGSVISWGVQFWYIPIGLVVGGTIGLVTVNRKQRGKHGSQKQYSNGKLSIGTILSYLKKHKVIISVLLVIIFIFTIRLEAWAWLAIGVFAVGILPPLIMFVFYNLIAKAIWREK